MKTLKLTTLLLAVALVFGSTSCKYEDGPGISLRTKKARLAGDWIIEKYEDADGSGVNVAESDSPVYTFKKDGTGAWSYTGSWGNSSGTFKWEFTDSKKKIKLIDESGSFDSEEILRLTNKEFWTKDSDGDKTFWKSK